MVPSREVDYRVHRADGRDSVRVPSRDEERLLPAERHDRHSPSSAAVAEAASNVPGAALAAAGAGAAEGLVRGLAVELAPVRVNAVRAGAFRTPLWDAVPEAQRDTLFARLAQRTLIGTVGEPEQIAAAHLYLMQNTYVTGTVLTVDGGLLLTGS